jgi:hypothetical protein
VVVAFVVAGRALIAIISVFTLSLSRSSHREGLCS